MQSCIERDKDLVENTPMVNVWKDDSRTGTDGLLWTEEEL